MADYTKTDPKKFLQEFKGDLSAQKQLSPDERTTLLNLAGKRLEGASLVLEEKPVKAAAPQKASKK